MANSLNILDIVILVILLISAMLALFRGFVQEILAIAAWVGAAFCAVWGLPLARPEIRPMVHPDWLADTVAGVAIFLVTLVFFSLITHAIARRVQESALGALDRSLGVLFGLVRGAVVVVVAYIVMSWAFPPPTPGPDAALRYVRPTWIREARSLPLLDQGAALARTVIPASLLAQEKTLMDSTTASITGKVKAVGEITDGINKLQPPPGTATVPPLTDSILSPPPVAQPSPPSAATTKPKAYTPGQTQSIDQLSKNNQ